MDEATTEPVAFTCEEMNVLSRNSNYRKILKLQKAISKSYPGTFISYPTFTSMMLVIRGSISGKTTSIETIMYIIMIYMN